MYYSKILLNQYSIIKHKNQYVNCYFTLIVVVVAILFTFRLYIIVNCLSYVDFYFYVIWLKVYSFVVYWNWGQVFDSMILKYYIFIVSVAKSVVIYLSVDLILLLDHWAGNKLSPRIKFGVRFVRLLFWSVYGIFGMPSLLGTVMM